MPATYAHYDMCWVSVAKTARLRCTHMLIKPSARIPKICTVVNRKLHTCGVERGYSWSEN